MATVRVVDFSASTDLDFAVPNISKEAVEQASYVLQENHDKNDIIFTDQGLHNHIVHHICTSLALGATPDTLNKNYKENDSYQRPPPPLHDDLSQRLHDPSVFISNMFRPKTYSDYLKFIISEIESKGHEAAIHEYIFADNERAKIMFNRLFAGYLHPIIHLGFGVEFRQPAIIAEALAQTAIHPTFLDQFFIDVDAAVMTQAPKAEHLVEIMDKIREDPKLPLAAHRNDDHKVRDGILVRAKEEMIDFASRWQVDGENIEDFYYMHALNSSIFFSTFLRQPWISHQNKVKLLNWKGSPDLCLYASRRAPPLLLNEISSYASKHGQLDGWDHIFKRAREFMDDGHSCKMICALAHGEKVCKPFEERNEHFRIKGEMWLKLGNMGMRDASFSIM
ncbi:MAG: hypothetical protein Q9222_005222 [Ikaeria aurantiellina]